MLTQPSKLDPGTKKSPSPGLSFQPIRRILGKLGNFITIIVPTMIRTNTDKQISFEYLLTISDHIWDNES